MSVEHPFPPVVDAACRVLVLGSFPSVKSREEGFFYGHPRNRFWPLMAALFGEAVPQSIPEKRALLLRHHIALWDVLRACSIEGADDGSIRQPEINDLRRVLDRADIRAIFTTGTKAAALYRRYCLPVTGRPAIPLPSTSPANCRATLDDLTQAYRAILAYI